MLRGTGLGLLVASVGFQSQWVLCQDRVVVLCKLVGREHVNLVPMVVFMKVVGGAVLFYSCRYTCVVLYRRACFN